MNGPSTAPILTSLRLLKALDLARRGKIKAAQAVLENEGAPPENPVELHALAALVTREGDYLRALRLWRLLLEREPGHYEAKRMIAFDRAVDFAASLGPPCSRRRRGVGRGDRAGGLGAFHKQSAAACEKRPIASAGARLGFARAIEAGLPAPADHHGAGQEQAPAGPVKRAGRMLQPAAEAGRAPPGRDDAVESRAGSPDRTVSDRRGLPEETPGRGQGWKGLTGSIAGLASRKPGIPSRAFLVRFCGLDPFRD